MRDTSPYNHTTCNFEINGHTVKHHLLYYFKFSILNFYNVTTQQFCFHGNKLFCYRIFLFLSVTCCRTQYLLMNYGNSMFGCRITLLSNTHRDQLTSRIFPCYDSAFDLILIHFLFKSYEYDHIHTTQLNAFTHRFSFMPHPLSYFLYRTKLPTTCFLRRRPNGLRTLNKYTHAIKKAFKYVHTFIPTYISSFTFTSYVH